MPELTIYDSQGKQYDDDGRGRADQRIKDFFFGGVRVYVETGSRAELVVFFRARESNAGRAEQYYAVYRARSRRDLFENFASALQRRVETDLGMTLETSSSDVQIFEALARDKDGRLPGDDFDHEVITHLLNNGRQLRFGVSSNDAALGLLNEYLDEPARSVAIAEDTNIDGLDGCDLSIEIGGKHRGLTPLGETSQLMAETRKQQEGKLISSKVKAIKRDVDDLRRQTGASDERIRNALKREVSILESPPSRASSRNDGGRLGGLSGKQKLGVVGVGGIVAIVVLAILGLNVAAFLGSGVPAAGPLVFVGDDVSPSKIIVNGDPLENESFEAEAGPLKVGVETDQERLLVGHDMDEGESVAENETVNGTANVTLEDLPKGEGNLTIAIGEDPKNDSVWEKTVSITVTDSSDDSSDENSDDGGEDDTEEGAAGDGGDQGSEKNDTDQGSGEGAGNQDSGENDTDQGNGDQGSDSENESDPTEDTDPTLENLAVNGTAFEDNVSVAAGSISVTGETDREEVRVSYEWNRTAEESPAESGWIAVESGTFDVTLTDVPESDGTMAVAVKNESDENPAEAKEAWIEVRED